MIFLYEKAAKVPSNHLRMIREAGIVAVQVSDMSKCKLLDPDMVQLTANDTLLSALDAIASDKSYRNETSKMFVQNLLAALSAIED